MTAISEELSDERLAFFLSEFRTVTDRQEGCSLDRDQSGEVYRAILELQSLRSGNGGEVRAEVAEAVWGTLMDAITSDLPAPTPLSEARVKAAWDAYVETSIHMENSNLDCMRAALAAALSTPPVGAETGEPVAWERTEVPVYDNVAPRIDVTRDPELAEMWRNHPFTQSMRPLFAAPPRSDKANVDLVTEVEGLIDAYWSIAYDEGYFRRETDTPDGPAQATRSAISRRLRAFSTSPAVPNTVGEDKRDKLDSLVDFILSDDSPVTPEDHEDIALFDRAIESASIDCPSCMGLGGDEDTGPCSKCGSVSMDGEATCKAEYIATVLSSDPYDDEGGPLYATHERRKLEELKPGDKLYVHRASLVSQGAGE